MERFFNIAGPCNPAKHYMLSATDRLPDVVSLIRENPIHLDYLYYMASSEWVKPIVDAGLRGMLTGEQREDVRFDFLMSLGFFCEVNGIEGSSCSTRT